MPAGALIRIRAILSIALVARITETLETADGVGAGGVLPTTGQVLGTLVDVRAPGDWFALHTLRANTRKCPEEVQTLGTRGTGVGRTHVLGCAAPLVVSVEANRTGAIIPARVVHALGRVTTLVRAIGTLVNLGTRLPIAAEAGQALARM